MRRQRLPLTLTLLLAVGAAVYQWSHRPPQPVAGTSQPTWRACFSPAGGCTQLVVETIAQAQQTIFVQAYSFTSAPIANALIAAHRRGVHVEVIADKSQPLERYSRIAQLTRAGMPVWIDALHAIAHNKLMVIDEALVITGSFNFTKAAEQENAENLLVLRDATLAAQYAANWNRHQAHSRRYATTTPPHHEGWLEVFSRLKRFF